jgi:epoxyqueuosine reductase
VLSRERVIARAREAGFDLCGIARAGRPPKLARLAGWIAQGRAGGMTWLADSLGERLDPAQVLPTVRSIVSVAVVYHTVPDAARPDRAPDVAPPDPVRVSRYAWGDDYHDVMRPRLTALLSWMAEQAGRGFEAFSCVDAGPVQERVFAEQAGLGWIGKNTCLISPTLGSWLFLGEILCNADLEPDEPGVDQCGACTRCLDACPTQAFAGPYDLDATRCLSYLTIEAREDPDEPLREAVREQVYGCDICQDVCPWNRRAPVSGDPAWQPRDSLRSPGLLALCRLGDDEWRGLLRGSAMRRAGLRRIRRSLAYAAAHAPADRRRDALAALAAHPSARSAEVARAIAWAGRADVP